MSLRLVLVMAIACLAEGCGASSGAVGDAIFNTAIAAGASGARRASGDCYTPCVQGTVCNPSTGYCDPLPCRGECQEWERCERGAIADRCVPAKGDLQIEQKTQASAPAPADPH